MTAKQGNGMRRRRGRKETVATRTTRTSLQKETVQSPSPVHVLSSALWRRLLLAVLSVALVGILLFAVLWHGDGAVTDDTTTNEESSIISNHEPQINHDHHVVLEVLPHDPSAFTQGLTFFDGNLYEGTGMYGQSQLRRVDPQSGSVLSSHEMDRAYFGEGIAHFIDATGEMRLIQLTWREKRGFIYRMLMHEDFQVTQEFTYETSTGEGWGITYDEASREFVVSDGSSWLAFWDRDSLQEKRRTQVKLKRQQQSQQEGQHQVVQVVSRVNELEWDNGTILANVWYKDELIRIDPATGFVIQVYDFSHLYKDRTPKADCFNGIALTDTPGELFVTGKWWPHMYRVKLLV
jgi:glutamine cyclotransferase